MELLRTILLPIAVAACLLGWPTGASGQPGGADFDDPALLAQLTRLNDSLERIASLLEQNLAEQRLGLLIQRIELGADRLVQAEQNLRTARRTRTALEDEKLEAEARLAQLAEELDRGQLDIPAEEIELMTNDLDLRLELLENRIRAASREVAQLENEAAARRTEIRDWQEYVDRELSSP